MSMMYILLLLRMLVQYTQCTCSTTWRLGRKGRYGSCVDGR